MADSATSAPPAPTAGSPGAPAGSGTGVSPGSLQGAATPMLTLPAPAPGEPGPAPAPGPPPVRTPAPGEPVAVPTPVPSHADPGAGSLTEPAPQPGAPPVDPLPDPIHSPHGHEWSIPWAGSGAAIIVSGGTISVSTDDLDATASSLTLAAASLDDARTHAQAALSEVQARPAPVAPDPMPSTQISLIPACQDPYASAPAPIGAVRSCTPGVPAPTSPLDGLPAFTEPGSLSSWAPGQWDPAITFELRRSTAVTALNSLISGPGSLQDTASALRALASDLSACSELYGLAEGSATPGAGTMGPVDMRAFDNMLLNRVLGPAVAGAGLALTPGTDLYQWILDNVSENEMMLAGVQSLTVLLNDPATAQWVKNDIARLILLSSWLSQARTGREAVTIQAYLDSVARRIDPWVSQQLPETTQVGTRTVSTASLTPMQRACLHLAGLSGRSGAGIFGSQAGLSVTPLNGRGRTRLPPAREDPYGLGTPVAPGLLGAMTPSSAPRTISETISHCQSVQSIGSRMQDEGEEAGVISIQRTEHADGRVSWVVYVPGTTDWTSGDHEPQDLLTNLEAVAGVPTVMESAVVTAMRQAGIQSGQEVALYGHSQGGITVSNLAADPAIKERYTITSVLTAGSPTAEADIPDDVQVLHLENTGDAVPGLEGRATPTGPHRQVALIDTHQLGIEQYPHGSDVYARATQGIEEAYPEIAPWSESFNRVTGAGEEGAVTTEQVFAIQRDLNDPAGPAHRPGSGPPLLLGTVPRLPGHAPGAG
ncbi:hypothetical protein EII10_03840 [Actinomyces bowdenii]|uniref:Alpha/beta hydrolase n=1 Tax=Actinomyces bowdenii TaxID=131109 RepID=A0A3P1VC87_9ACTO|nr:hypothetical protein EII10_03840 [Actinomyces bowdenii]